VSFEQQEIEGTAEAVYAAAGMDPNEAAHSVELARNYPGIVSVEFVSGLGEAASLEFVDDARTRARIRVARKRSRVAHNWLVAHELAEFVCARTVPDEGRAERLANRLAAALVTPRRAFLAAVREHGPDIELLAALFTCSQLTVALRVGEVFDWPVAVIGGLFVPRAGPAHLPPTPVLRDHVARALDGAVLPPGLRIVRLTDSPNPLVAVIATE